MSEVCEVCGENEATMFMVIRQTQPAGERVAKSHVCVTCFGLLAERQELKVEEISYRDFKEVVDGLISR